MKFPRNARIFRGQLDAAPFAAVFFLLVIFLMLGSVLYTPGVLLQLPTGADLPGTDRNHVNVAIDANGRMYFENQNIEEKQLRDRLRQAVQSSAEPLEMVVQADKAASLDMLMHLALLGRDVGIAQCWWATLPRPVTASP
jgi:biopolymer transport protein ExbD